MQCIRPISPWLLLVLMAFGMVPREALHGGIHDRDGHPAATHGATVDEACALCAIGALVADVVRVFHVRPPVTGHTDVTTPYLLRGMAVLPRTGQARGPPSFPVRA